MILEMRIHLDKAAMFGAVIVLWQFLNNSTSLPDLDMDPVNSH